MDPLHDPIPLVRRLLQLAAARVGGPEELARHLGLTEAELARHLRGEAMPPFKALLSAVDLVVEQVNLADRPWRSVLVAYQAQDER